MFRNGRSPHAVSGVRPEAGIWRALRNTATWLAVLGALYALLGFLVLPTLLKPRLEATLSERFSRQATLGRLEFNPFTWHARLQDFALTDRDRQRPFVRFDALDLDVSPASISHRAPVLDAVHLVRPRVDLIRNEDGTYSVDDLVARPATPPAAFSLNNIDIDDATVTLDDRPHAHKVVVSSLDIGIPFVSSIPHDAQIRVTPRLRGAVDGTPFALKGDLSSPFAETREATLDLDLEALPVPRYAEYVSLPGKTRLSSGALTTRLKLAFVTQKGVARTVSLSGSVRVDQPALTRSDGTRLASAHAIDLALGKLDVLGQSVALSSVSIDAPDADVRRASDGTLELARIFGADASKAADRNAVAARPWAFSVAAVRLAGGTLRITDAAVSPAFGVVLSGVAVEGRSLASSGAPGTLDLRFDTDDSAHAELHAEIDLAALEAHGHVALARFHLARLYPYYAAALNLDVRSGSGDLAGDFDTGRTPSATRFRLTNGTAALADFETALRGEKDGLWNAKRAELAGVAFDLEKRDIAIDRVALQQASLNVVRERNGAINFERLVRGEATGASAQGGAAGEPGWRLRIARFDIERLAANVQDRMPTPPVKLRVTEARIGIDAFSNAADARSGIDLAARIGTKGRLHLKGTIATRPVVADLRVDAAAIDVLPLRPYFEPRTNVIVTSGFVAAKGRMTYGAAKEGAPSVTYKGDVTLSDFGSLDRPTSQELMRWKALRLMGVDSRSRPLAINVASIALDQFFARVILNADATLNLRRLVAPQTGGEPAQAAATTAGGMTTAELPARSEGEALPVSIGRIEVSNGEVDYSDYFVQPNYQAHLTHVTGRVSALSATQAGDVEIDARVEGTAPVDVRGTLDPFARKLSLDLTAKATDVDLPPLTPYSIKYAGYGITKGKLSLEVHYKVDDRKLAATNKLRLDQLTFGERVDSPSATKLPVLLAVSLLKDRNGVINLDLPIAGTLDDPKFSVWRVVVQIFVNLITKAVTAPFALLASLGGGGGEQLAYIEFVPGRAQLSPAAVEKLGTLAKALNDRPALKLDAAGRAVPDVDRDGLRKASLERALLGQKQKALAAEGESAPPLDTLTIDAAEYSRLLEEVYRATDLPNKPRNFFGIPKKIPTEEMEALLLAGYKVDDEALATLANRRALTVKEWFVRQGAVASERIFVLSPKLTGDGITDKGAPTRVDFAIR